MFHQKNSNFFFPLLITIGDFGTECYFWSKLEDTKEYYPLIANNLVVWKINLTWSINKHWSRENGGKKELLHRKYYWQKGTHLVSPVFVWLTLVMPSPKGDAANLSRSSIGMVGWGCWASLPPQSLLAWAYWGVASSQHTSFSLVPRGGLQVAPAPPCAPMGLLVVPQWWHGEDQASSTPSSAGASVCRGSNDHLPI